MVFAGGPSLTELLSAVRAEARQVDLDGAVRRAGAENVVLETDEWIYRFPRDWIDFDREVAVLAMLGDRLPVAIPQVEWTGSKTRFCVYRKITGFRLDRDAYLSADRVRQRALADSMAEYLAITHEALTATEIAKLGIPDLFPLTARADLINLDDIPVAIHAEIAELLDRARRAAKRIADEKKVLLHNDFTSDNIVFDDGVGRMSGAWDFSGVSMGPASLDFRYLVREPDPLTADVVRRYEFITGRDIDREALVTSGRIGDVVHLVRRGSPEQLISMVRGWERDRI